MGSRSLLDGFLCAVENLGHLYYDGPDLLVRTP